jgi:hypothetical protein
MIDPKAVKSFTEEDFTYEFFLDLHCLVAIDAVTEFGYALKEHKPELLPTYIVKLCEYYIQRNKVKE